MVPSYRQALDRAIATMMREAVEYSVALRNAVEQVDQLMRLRRQVGNTGSANGQAYPPRTTPFEHLTRREHDVLAQLVRGHSNRQIATSLGISERTVKNHLRSIFTKLDVGDRTSAVVKALTKR